MSQKGHGSLPKFSCRIGEEYLQLRKSKGTRGDQNKGASRPAMSHAFQHLVHVPTAAQVEPCSGPEVMDTARLGARLSVSRGATEPPCKNRI